MSTRESFSKREVELADLSKSVGHPARFFIIKELSKAGKLSNGELVDRMALSQASVSQHLKTLVDEGLICRLREGQKSMYTIEWNKLERMLVLFQKLKDDLMVNRPKRNCC